MIITPEPHVPAPHPAAPPEVRTTFGEFRRKFKSYSAPTPRKNPSEAIEFYNNIWEAPSRFWRSRLQVSEREMDLVMVCDSCDSSPDLADAFACAEWRRRAVNAHPFILLCTCLFALAPGTKTCCIPTWDLSFHVQILSNSGIDVHYPQYTPDV